MESNIEWWRRIAGTSQDFLDLIFTIGCGARPKLGDITAYSGFALLVALTQGGNERFERGALFLRQLLCRPCAGRASHSFMPYTIVGR